MLRRLGKAFALALGLFVLVFMLLPVLLNTYPGRQSFERAVSHLSDGAVLVTGLSGHFPGNLAAERIEVRDPLGSWLILEQVALAWSPSKLISRQFWIHGIRCERGRLERLPEYPSDPETSDWFPGFKVYLGAMQVPQLDLGPSVTGNAASLQISASGRLDDPQRGAAELTVQRRDGEGRYQAEAHLQPKNWQLTFTADEPAGGLLAAWAGWTALPRWSLRGQLAGPPGGALTSIQLHTGELEAAAQGTVDLTRGMLNLEFTATSPELSWRPGYSWRSASLSGTLLGTYTQPTVNATLRVEDLRAADTHCERASANISGNAEGAAHLHAQFEGLRLPGPRPDLFATAPVTVFGDLQLAQTDLPATLAVNHPLLTIRGQGLAGGDRPRGEFAITLPDLFPLAAAAGLNARGRMELQLVASRQQHETRLEADASLRLSGGDPRLVALLGDQAKLVARVASRPSELKMERLGIDGKGLQFSGDGRYAGSRLQADWKMSLPNLRALSGSMTGNTAITGRVFGSLEALSLVATLSGEASSEVLSGGPYKGEFALSGFPAALTGSIGLNARVAGSNLDLAAKFARPSTGEATIALESAKWRSLCAQGAWTWSLPATWPVGRLELTAGRLDDLSTIAGIPLAGTGSANVTTAARGVNRYADFKIAGSDLRLGDVRAVGLQTSGHIADDERGLQVEGKLDLARYTAGRFGGDAALAYRGPLNALALRLTGTASGAGTEKIAGDGEATLDGLNSRLAVHRFEARWQNEVLRLKIPAQISFADGVRVDRLVLGLRDGELLAAGRFSPSLDLEGRIERVPVDLAKAIYSDLDGAHGAVGATFRLRGPYDGLQGDLRLSVTGFLPAQAARIGLPPAQANAELGFAGGTGQLDARLRAGPLVAVSIRGGVPARASGTLDLIGDGTVDLRVLDPWLTPRGQRAHGVLSLQSRIQGALAEPRATGELRWAKGGFQDSSTGLRASDIAARAQLDGSTISLTQFDGKMAPGRVSAAGKVDFGQLGYPLELKITARNARPLSGDRLNVTVNSDIELRKLAGRDLTVSGSITVLRAEIRIPERMPARIAVLDVRKPGAPPPPPPATQPAIGLSLSIDAPAEIFARGRGLDAELSGKVRLTGTMSDPEPSGAFLMRRGEYRLAGRTLSFSKGEVGFDGGTLTDPSLDFIASTTNANITATLAIGGTASKPKISLSSAPDLPQDEILAHLLFGRNTASLGPLELAEIASAVASLTGVGGNLTNPLDMLRKGIGLDRLSMGSDKAGPTLEAGRYIAPGIYLGAKQGFTGATPSAALQVDVAKGLKVEGTVGTGSPTASQSGTTSVGVIYQYEY